MLRWPVGGLTRWCDQVVFGGIETSTHLRSNGVIPPKTESSLLVDASARTLVLTLTLSGLGLWTNFSLVFLHHLVLPLVVSMLPVFVGWFSNVFNSEGLLTAPWFGQGFLGWDSWSSTPAKADQKRQPCRRLFKKTEQTQKYKTARQTDPNPSKTTSWSPKNTVNPGKKKNDPTTLYPAQPPSQGYTLQGEARCFGGLRAPASEAAKPWWTVKPHD